MRKPGAPRRFARKDLSETEMFCFAPQPTGFQKLAELGRPGCQVGPPRGANRVGSQKGSVYLVAPALLPETPGTHRVQHTQFI